MEEASGANLLDDGATSPDGAETPGGHSASRSRAEIRQRPEVCREILPQYIKTTKFLFESNSYNDTMLHYMLFLQALGSMELTSDGEGTTRKIGTVF
jgi:hypothetical protein